MRDNRLRKAVLAALAPAGVSLAAASMANAQLYKNTYDTSSSITTNGAGVYDGSSENWRFDYGGFTPTSNKHNPVWTGTEDDTGNSGGSVKLSWMFNATADGGESAAYTDDLFATPGEEVTNISFNLMVDPSSTPDIYGGYGYFQVFARNESYGGFSTSYVNEELGNPTYSDPDDGTWESIDISLSSPIDVRALTFQDYTDGPGGRDIVGPETIYIDNLAITYEVPEPASLGLLGVGVPALLMRRRSKVKTV